MCAFQVKGDNFKRTDNGELVAEMGCDLFVRTGQGNEYKPMDDTWWLIEHYDFLQEVDPPTMEKVSKNRIKYRFHIQ